MHKTIGELVNLTAGLLFLYNGRQVGDCHCETRNNNIAIDKNISDSNLISVPRVLKKWACATEMNEGHDWHVRYDFYFRPLSFPPCRVDSVSFIHPSRCDQAKALTTLNVSR